MEDERRIVVQEKRWSAREEVEQDCSMHRTVEEEEEVRGKVWGEGRGERERGWRNGGRRRVGKDVGDEERRIEEDEEEEEEEEEEVKMVQLGRHRHRSRR